MVEWWYNGDIMGISWGYHGDIWGYHGDIWGYSGSSQIITIVDKHAKPSQIIPKNAWLMI